MAWGILVILVAITPVILMAAGLADLAGRRQFAVQATASSVLMGVVILAVVWFFSCRGFAPASRFLSRSLAHSLAHSLGMRRPDVSWIWAGLLTIAVLGVNLGVTSLYVLAVRWLDAGPLMPPELGPQIVFPGAVVLVSFAALAIWTPVTEELFFRGFVFPGIVHRLGRWWAMAASAAIFSAFHLDPGVLVPVFFTGLLLAWLYHRTGSIWPGVGVHAAQNSLALLGAIYGV